MTYDCIVIGLGGMGSGALYHLARRGARVLGIEQFGPAHNRGSSHGLTRIIRQAYFEHPDYVPLLRAAYDLWRELEAAVEKPLMTLNGLVLSGPPNGETITGAMQAARQHGLSVERLEAADARQRFPRYRFPDKHVVVHEPHAGYLCVESCVAAHVNQARQLKAETHFHKSVQQISASPNGVTVRTDRGTYSAQAVIFAGGAWADRLLGPALPPLRVLRKVQFWHGMQPMHPAYPQPAFFFELPEGTFYGIPTPADSRIKVAEHSGGLPVADPRTVDRTITEHDEAPIRRFVDSTLSGVNSQSSSASVCMYTMSPDGHFILDQHPQHANIVLAAGFSGHGFKFASVIGQILADLALTGKTAWPIEFLNLKRFGDAPSLH